MKRIFVLILFAFILLTACHKDPNKENEEAIDSCDHSYTYELLETQDSIECKCEKCDFSYKITPNFNFSYNYGYFDLERFLIKKNAQKLYIKIYSKLLEFNSQKKDINVTKKDDKEYYIIDKINFTDFSINKNQVMAIWHLVMLDNPEFYFVEKTVLTSADEIVLLCNKLYAKYEQRKVVDDKLNEVDLIAFKGTTDRETISNIHDYVISNMTYAYELINGEKVAKTDFDSYELSGALAGEGVCEAYCKLFGHLLKVNGIKSIMYAGDGILLSGSSVRHSWTLVLIDDLYYGFDLTWNDSNSNKDNYGLSYENLALRHHPIPFNSSTLEIGIDYIYNMPKMAEENLA